MIKVTLPDGSVREIDKGSSSLDVAKSISEGLARNVLAAEVDGEIWDLSRALEKDVSLKLLTFQNSEGKSTLWHSSAHLMAEALEFFYPGIKLAIGPPIENGFYYDVDFGDYDISEKEFPKIEQKILELARGKTNLLAKKFLKKMPSPILPKRKTHTNLNF